MATRTRTFLGLQCYGLSYRASRLRGLTIVLSVLLVGALFYPLPYTLSNGSEEPCDCEGKPKAYILVGDISGPAPVQNGYKNAANEAVSDFLQAGYDVVKVDKANVKDVQDAFNDPCAKAIMIIGHGGGEEYKTIGGKTLMKPIESIAMNDGWITGDPNIANTQGDTLLPQKSCVKSVYLHSCNQDLPSWRALFPNAEFHAWSTRALYWAIFWWQWFHRPTPAELIGQATGSPSVPELTGEQTAMLASDLIEYTRPDAPGIMAVPPQYMLWSPPSEYVLAVSDLSANFYAASDDGLDQLYLFGLTTTDTEIGYVDTVLTGPTAEITLRNSGLMSILENPSRFVFAIHTGDINAAGDYTLTELEMTILGAMVFGPEVMEPRIPLIEVFDENSLLARTGMVAAKINSRGVASGLIAFLTLTSMLDVPIIIDIENSSLKGMVLVNPNEDEQDQIISVIPGISHSVTYTPASNVTLNPGENVTLPIIGYCLNADKGNPTNGTGLTLDPSSTKTDITPVLGILDTLENTTFPEYFTDTQEVIVKQVALWAAQPENQEKTREAYAERGYSVGDEEIQIIKDIFTSAQMQEAISAYLFQKRAASFSVDDLTIAPSSVIEGETVTISVDVTNTGNLTGSHTVTLMVDDEVKDEETVTLNPDEKETVSFEVSASQPGTFSVEINGLSGSYAVTEPEEPSFWDRIPGFPYESVILGLVIGVLVLWLIQRRNNI